MLIDLMKPAGPAIARRWLSALLLVPEDERERVVSAVEQSIVAEFAPEGSGSTSAERTAGGSS